MKKFDIYIKSKKDLISAVQKFGFIPLFTNSITGFSVEENVAPDVWFSDKEGVWEWKGPVIRECNCAYGKFFENKAVFISSEFFSDFANYRRDGYDFDSRFDDGLASYRDLELFNLVNENAPILSKELKRIGDYRKEGKKGFDTIINRLQAECYVIIGDFKYEVTKDGRKYGWGVAEYTTPEAFFGKSFISDVYKRTPGESYRRIFNHLKDILPEVSEEIIKKILK